MLAVAWPSWAWTALTLAPWAISSDAQVWRRSLRRGGTPGGVDVPPRVFRTPSGRAQVPRHGSRTHRRPAWPPGFRSHRSGQATGARIAGARLAGAVPAGLWHRAAPGPPAR